MFRRDFLGSVLGLLPSWFIKNNSPITIKGNRIFHNNWGELKRLNLSGYYKIQYEKVFDRPSIWPVEYDLILEFEQMEIKWSTMNLPMSIYLKLTVDVVTNAIKLLPNSIYPREDDLTGWDLIIDGHRFKPVYFMKTIN